MAEISPSEPRPPLTRGVWWVAAAITLLALSTAGRYGYFRDELYYLMCADHPAWGYVDHPPLAMVFLTGWKALFGESIVALRLPPALLVGGVSVGTAMLAREMRGGASAQIVAALAAGLMPGVLALGAFYSMNSFDVAFWVLVAWIACRLLDPEANRRWWWALGVAVGLGLLNKYSMLFLAVGLGAGILLSPLRGELLSRERILGSLVVVVLVLPHGIWQVLHGWPTLEFIRNAHDLKNVAMPPAVFWGEQLLMSHPLFVPLWVTGLAALLFSSRMRRWRPLGVAFVVVSLWLTFSHAKPYYLVAAYPMVMAAGAVVLARAMARRPPLGRIGRVALPALVILAGVLVAPMAIPLLGPEDYVSYERALGLRPRAAEHGEEASLPQHFADRFGWPELARSVRSVVQSLPAAERSRALVLTGNYGECGALNLWGLGEGVSPAVSGHNSCAFWWPDELEAGVVVVVGYSREEVESAFEEVERAATHRSRWAMPYESKLPIWVARGWKLTPTELRERVRQAV